jgi:hypothetical protein
MGRERRAGEALIYRNKAVYQQLALVMKLCAPAAAGMSDTVAARAVTESAIVAGVERTGGAGSVSVSVSGKAMGGSEEAMDGRGAGMSRPRMRSSALLVAAALRRPDASQTPHRPSTDGMAGSGRGTWGAGSHGRQLERPRGDTPRAPPAPPSGKRGFLETSARLSRPQ